MPKFKKIEIGGNGQYWSFQININADGEFYTKLPDELADVIVGTSHMTCKGGKCFAKTFDSLRSELNTQISCIVAPEVVQEHVILYWVLPSVSFCTDGTPDSEIYRNGSEVPNRDYHWCDEKKYRRRSCQWCNSTGGMGFYIGAVARIKTTTKLHNRDKVEYLNSDNELANKTLNAWCLGLVPSNANEMPYSDEAALFFDHAIRQIVEASRKVVDFLDDRQKLIYAIENGNNLLEGPKT